MAASATKQIVIVGGGITGVSSAYYLATRRGIKTTLIDPVGIAPAASGKAGGFLAFDWNDGSPTGPLTRTSFGLHQELADTLGATNIDYRRLTCDAGGRCSSYAKGCRPRMQIECQQWHNGMIPWVGAHELLMCSPRVKLEAV